MSEHPLEAMRRQVHEARDEFARDVDEVIAHMKETADALGSAIGEIGRDEALDCLRRVTVKAIDRCAERHL